MFKEVIKVLCHFGGWGVKNVLSFGDVRKVYCSLGRLKTVLSFLRLKRCPVILDVKKVSCHLQLVSKVTYICC